MRTVRIFSMGQQNIKRVCANNDWASESDMYFMNGNYVINPTNNIWNANKVIEYLYFIIKVIGCFWEVESKWEKKSYIGIIFTTRENLNPNS